MAIRRGGTPLLSSNAPSLEAANQSQINDLIQRNRTLEHTTQKLSTQLTEQINRSKASVKEIQDKHEASQRQWKESCEDVLASYQIIQKRLEVELEKERYATLAEMGVTRHEKLQRIQRDFKLKLFQMQEEELERRLEAADEENGDLREQRHAINRKWMDSCLKYHINLKEAQAALKASERERQDKEMKLNKLRESFAMLDAEKGTFTSKIKRVELNLGHEQDKNQELTKELNEAKRRIKELSRQVEEWQKLERSEGAEVETQQKKRVALEQEVQELRDHRERELDRLQRALEKEKERGAKIKEARDGLEEEAKNNKKEADKANTLVKKLEKQLAKLKEDLEVERARVRPASPEKPHVSTPTNHAKSDEENTNNGKTSTRPSSKRGLTVKAGLSNKFGDIEADGSAKQVQVARKRTGGKKPTLSKRDSGIEEIPGTDADEVQEPRRNRKGKAKATESDATDEDERPTAKKRKATSDAEDQDSVEIIEPPKAKAKRGGARAGSRAPSGVGRGRSKPPNSRAESRQRSVKPAAEEGAEEDQGPRKRRKVNLFPTSEDKGASVVLAAFGSNGMAIPSYLSPVKQDEPVPQRSTSIMGSLSSIMRMPFPR